MPYIKMIAEHYGKDHQLLKMSEECGELSTAIARFILKPTNETYENLVEEMADVKIMIRQMEHLLGVEDEVVNTQVKKIMRQLKRMENV